MKQKLVFGVALTALCALGGLTGCQKKKDKFEISISARSLVSEQEMLNIWKREYETLHPNVKINVSGWGGVEGTSEDYVMKNALNRSALTNIIYTTDDSTANLAQKKNFVDLRPFYEASPETDYTKYYTTMLDLTSFYGEFRPTENYHGDYDCEKSNDAQYGVYFAPREYNMPALLCNVSLFKEHFATEEEKANWNKDSLKALFTRIGDGTEWNWTTFVKALQNISDKCATLNASGDLGYRACELNHTWEPVYTTIMKELGGDGIFAMNDYGETVVNLDSTANKAAYTQIIDDFGKNAHKYMIDTDYGNDNFKLHNVFCVMVSYPEVGNFYGAYKKVNLELGAVNFPAEYVAAGCGGYGILVDKKDQVQKLTSGEEAKTVDLCWDFIKYIISKDGQNAAGKEGYVQPVLKELATTGEWVESYDGKIDNLAFSTAKELALDTFCFANPSARNSLRKECITPFFRELFDPKTNSYNDLLTKAINDTNKALKDAQDEEKELHINRQKVKQPKEIF